MFSNYAGNVNLSFHKNDKLKELNNLSNNEDVLLLTN